MRLLSPYYSEHDLAGPQRGDSPGSTYPAVAGTGLAVAEQGRGPREPVFLILSEYADPLGCQGHGPVEPVLWHLPGPAEMVPWLEAVAQEAPRVLFGRGFELLPIFVDLF